MASSLTWACFLVSAPIQETPSISLDSAFSNACTIFRVRSFPSAPKVWATYSLPTASPKSPLVKRTQRFQRGASSFVPDSVLLKKLKFSSTNFVGSIAAVECTTCQRRYVFQSSSEVDAKVALNCLKKSGSATFNTCVGGAPMPTRYTFQPKSGLSASRSLTVIL